MTKAPIISIVDDEGSVGDDVADLVSVFARLDARDLPSCGHEDARDERSRSSRYVPSRPGFAGISQSTTSA